MKNNMRDTTKTEITKAECLQLMALRELALKYNRMLNEIYAAGQEITGEIWNGEPELYGHTCDFLSDDDANVNSLLKNLELKKAK